MCKNNSQSKPHVPSPSSPVETVRVIDLRGLKKFALEKLPRSHLRDLLLGENDGLSAQEFLAKLDVWIKLLGKECE